MPKWRDARGEHLGPRRQGREGRVAARAPASDRQPARVDRAPVHEEPRGRHAVIDVDDPPLALERVAVWPPVARRAAVVDVDHRDPPRREERPVERERGRCGRRRAAVRDHEQRRQLAGRGPGRRRWSAGSTGREPSRHRSSGTRWARRAGSTPASSGIARDRASTPVGRPVTGFRRATTAPSCGPAPISTAVPSGDLEPLDLAERRVHGFDGTSRASIRTSASRPSARATARIAAVVEERVRRAAEDPCGIAELRLHRRQVPGAAPSRPAVAVEREQVPPARRLVRHEVQHAVGAPGRLDDRDVRAAGDRPRGAERHRPSATSADPQADRVPGHVGVVPLEPGQRPAIGRRPGRGVEVGPGHEQLPGAVRSVERDRRPARSPRGPAGRAALASCVSRTAYRRSRSGSNRRSA